jgi:hypothetical protein
MVGETLVAILLQFAADFVAVCFIYWVRLVAGSRHCELQVKQSSGFHFPVAVLVYRS